MFSPGPLRAPSHPPRSTSPASSGAELTYRALYPGIDLTYAGNGGRLESTYTVAPGVTPSTIRWRYAGARHLAVDAQGNLQITLTDAALHPGPATLVEEAPRAWQEIGGQRQPVAVGYTRLPAEAVGFALGAYSPARAKATGLQPQWMKRRQGGPGWIKVEKGIASTEQTCYNGYQLPLRRSNTISARKREATMLVRQSFKYRLVLNRAQEAALGETVERCRELYNAALQERREAYRLNHKTLTFAQQSAELPAVKVERPEYRGVFSQTLQDVLHRLDRAYQAFFRRVQAGEKPGFPRFQGPGHYDSFTYPQYGNGATLEYDGSKWGRLTLSKLGILKVRIHRAVAGQIKTVTIRRDGEQWFVCFSCLVDVAPLPPTNTMTGIDLGLLHFATLADGSTIDNPRPLRRALKKLKRAQQHLSRCQKGRHRRVRAKREVARLHRKVRNQRADFCHKAARRLINEYGTVVFEDLAVRNMVQNHRLALSISDAGWGQFVQYCVVKAARAGRQVLFVDPRNTSKNCSGCGHPQKLTLAQRRHPASPWMGRASTSPATRRHPTSPPAALIKGATDWA